MFRTIEKTMLILLFSVFLILMGANARAEMVWEEELDSGIRFKTLHPGTGYLLVGTKSKLYAFDPETGEEIWQVEKVLDEYEPNAIQPVKGTNYIIYEKGVYLLRVSIGLEKIVCMDATTGKKVWELNTEIPYQRVPPVLFSDDFNEDRAAGAPLEHTPQLVCQNIFSATFDQKHNQLLLAVDAMAVFEEKITEGGGRRFQGGGIVCVDAETGKINTILPLLRERKYEGNPPIVVDDVVIVDWRGFYAFDLMDTSRVVRMGIGRRDLVGGNSPIQVEDGTAYLVASKNIMALNIDDGETLWKSQKIPSIVPEMHILEDRLVCRMGGEFPRKNGDMSEEHKPYGLLVLDKNTGEILYAQGKDKKLGRTTSLLIDDGIVYYGTGNSFRAFDLNALKYKYVVKLDKSHVQKKDEPRSLVRHGNKICLMLKQSTVAFHPEDGQIAWSKMFKPPKIGRWAKLAKVGKKGFKKGISEEKEKKAKWYEKGRYRLARVGQMRLQNAVASDSYNYVVTSVDGKPTIVGVSLASGEAQRTAVVEERSPDFTVGEHFGMLFNVQGKKTLQGFDLKEEN